MASPSRPSGTLVSVTCGVFENRLAKAVTGGSYILPWSLGALVAAGLEALGVDTGWQWLVFLGVSSVVLVIVQRSRLRRR